VTPMNAPFETLRELILSIVPEDGSSIGNQALLSAMREFLPEVTEAEYLGAKEQLVKQGILAKGRGRGGSVHRPTGHGHTLPPSPRMEQTVAPDEEYVALNNALNDFFFRGRFEMLPVYLDLEGDAETEISDTLGMEISELGDFVGLCTANTLRFDKTDPYADQVDWLKAWSEAGRREPPPFTALLVALSIAAERMGADENFSPNNYYERLFELLGVKMAGNQNKLRIFAKHTRQFWRALNLWLSENDFLLGRPTARALISHWQYASYALSQALVRDGDRKRFAGLFEAYDLVPGNPVAEPEMTLLVHDWMTSHGPSGPTAWLRTLWSSNDLRARVVLAALDAFETWERSSSQTQGGPKKTRLQWQLGFSGFPRKRARFALVAPRGGQAERVLPEPASKNFPPSVRLEDGLEAGTQILGPIEEISLDLVLLQSATFRGMESGTSYHYVAKPIVVLAKSPDGPTYQEVSRVSLFEEHAILCHEAWLEKVEGHLAKCARPGHVVLRASEMGGIPAGWCILRGVEIVRSLDKVHDNLHALAPIGGSAMVACVEGLKLGHGTWHVSAPPSVEATSEKDGCKLEIARELFGEADQVLAVSAATGNFMEARLDGITIPAGTNLRAVVKAKETELAEISFSLRNSDIPRPLGKRRLFHSISDEGSFALSAEIVGTTSRDGLEGCLYSGQRRRSDAGTGAFPSATPVVVPEGAQEMSRDAEWHHTPDAALKATESCVIKGYHYWVYEPFEKGDDRFEAKMAECKNCHVRALSRSRETARNNWRRIRQNEQPVPRKTRSHANRGTQVQVGHTEDGVASLDTIFDGLCYLGEGSWGAFQRLVSGASQEKWFSQSFASDLFALGNLETRDALLSPSSEWSVPPPVLVIGLDTRGRLAGFHSKGLIDRIDAALGREGGRHDPLSLPGQVTVHRWSGLVGLDVEALLRDVADPYGRPITVARDLGKSIASSLPNLESAWLKGSPIHVERSEDLERFDVRKARWTRVREAEVPGAYRVGIHGTRYFFRDGKGVTRQLGHQVAKILAARAEGTRLHGYEVQSGRFTAALGAEPPWLHARALVASSGKLPATEGGRLVYEHVDPQVAAIVLNRMYEGEIDLG